MRKTKIVCTIGPACDSEETLRAMMLAGMNVARLNFSHGTHAEHQVRIDRIKKLRAELDLPIAIMLDTKGPEYRIGTFENGKIELHSGDTFTFTTEPVTGNAERVSVSYAGLAQDLEPGDTVLVNDGLIALTVTATTDTDVVCRVTAGGVLSDRKSMSFPNKVLKQTFLSEQDKRDLLFGIENDVDFVAASFVSRRQDLVDLNGFLRAHGGGDISVIAKIENQPGIDNIEDIFTECTGIMIARGDMGVEVPYEELPSIQKELIGKCRLLGKRVITATEMLESMTHNIRPTRAEIADVANAVYDGTSAIMLSGETAAGEHPVEALSAMARIAEYTEAHINYAGRFPKTQFEIHDTLDAISHATCGMAIDIGAKVITVCSITGRTARLISRFRGPTDIIGLTTNERAYRKLAAQYHPDVNHDREHRRAVLPRAAGQPEGDAARKGRQGHHHRRNHQRPQRQHEHHQGRVRVRPHTHRCPGKPRRKRLHTTGAKTGRTGSAEPDGWCTAKSRRNRSAQWKYPCANRARSGIRRAAPNGRYPARHSRAHPKALRKHTYLPCPAREICAGQIFAYFIYIILFT